VLPLRGSIGKRPYRWEHLAYRCDECGVGLSNATRPADRRWITQTAEMNVPIEVRTGVEEILDAAVNVRNRRPKRWKFGSEVSEDAVTWTIVRALQRRDEVAALVPAELRGLASGEPAVLLWGAPAGGAGDHDLAERLRLVSLEFESPRSRTEPDVVIEWDDLLLVVEAKLGSANDLKKPGYSGWRRYTNDEAVRRTGLYELARNWILGAALARERTFVLCNLVVEVRDDLATLRDALRPRPIQHLVTRTWSDVVPRDEPWLVEYAKARKLVPDAS
jgi:hypothetical protein